MFLSSLILLGSLAWADDRPAVSCKAQTYSGGSGINGRCSFDEVVVGIESLDPLRVRCGRIVVTCNGKDVALEQGESAQTQE